MDFLDLFNRLQGRKINEALKYDEKYYVFLDKLRKSGVTNMFGASPYLQKGYGLDKKEAIAILSDWMETFSERHPQESKAKSPKDDVMKKFQCNKCYKEFVANSKHSIISCPECESDDTSLVEESKVNEDISPEEQEDFSKLVPNAKLIYTHLRSKGVSHADAIDRIEGIASGNMGKITDGDVEAVLKE